MNSLGELTFKTGVSDWYFPADRSNFPWYFPFWCNDRRCADAWRVTDRSSRVYLFPCNPGHVWSKPPENMEIWPCLYPDRACDSAGWYGDCVCIIAVYHPFSAWIHQKA